MGLIGVGGCGRLGGVAGDRLLGPFVVFPMDLEFLLLDQFTYNTQGFFMSSSNLYFTSV